MRLCSVLTLSATLLAAPLGAATQQDRAELVGGTIMVDRGPGVGGFSGLHLDADGKGFLALSDRGGLARGTLRRTATGQIIGVDIGPIIPILGRNGRPLTHSRADSEGLAVTPGGTIVISFEGQNRIETRGSITDPPRVLPRDPAFSRFPSNDGLESVAVAADGAIYTIPENGPLEDGTIPVYRFFKGKWTIVRTLPASGRFRPVEAEIGPDGALYVLERRFRGILGFASQVRRFSPTGTDPGETLLTTRTGEHDNLEGLSIWRGPDGDLRLTMISDDNFFPAQRTEIVEFALRKGLVLPAVAR